MTDSVKLAIADLEKKIEDRLILRARRQHSVMQLSRNIAQMRDELAKLKGIDLGPPSIPEKLPRGRGRLTFSIIEAIGAAVDGARAVEIEAALRERFADGIGVRSHYVLLSRLEKDGLITKDRGTYRLTDAGARALVHERWGPPSGDFV